MLNAFGLAQMSSGGALLPHEGGRTTQPEPSKWEQRSSSREGPEFLKNRLAADAVVSGGCVQGNNSEVRIMRAPNLHSMHQGIQASTIAKGILVWTSLLDGASELLRERARDNAPKEVANDQPTGTPARLSKGNNPAKSKRGQAGRRDLRLCKQGRDINERLRRLLIIQDHTCNFGSEPRRPGSSPFPGPA